MATNALASYNFPDAYYTNLIASATSVKYVSASGSDSNNGNTVTTPYLTIAKALTDTSAIATTVTIVILAGTYSITPLANGSSYATSAITDSNNPRVFVGCPGKVKIQFTNASGYGPYAVDFQNSGSACYGMIFERNNAGKTTNYQVAVFCGSATVGNLKGNFYNCAFTETNANNNWALQYDNEGRIASQVNYCTFKFNAAALADYTGSTGLVINYGVFSQANPGGNSTKSNTLYSQTVDATTYVTTGVTTAGVYAGTYAWNGTTTYPLSTAVVSATTGSPSTAFANIGGTNYRYYGFTSSGSITFSTGGDVDVLLVAGGGAGSGGTLGGGGGAGGLLTSTITTTATTYTITIGAGGSGGNPVGGNGGNTTALGLTAIGGGFGGTYGSNTQIGANGGSGGGGTYYPSTTAGIGVYPGSTYLNQTRQGYDGGVGRNFSVGAGTGGGGGAGAKGGDSGANDPGPSGSGGVGLQLNYNGSNLYYAGGGGGGGYNAGNDQGGGGGLGGGAGGGGVALGTSDTTRGATAPTTTVGGTAGVNTGGGGGGAPGTGGSGGSGIVIIRYAAQPLGLFSSSSNVSSGSNLTFTLYSANATGNVPYTISGVTSAQINNASLSGNFVLSAGTASLTLTTMKSIISANISISADVYTANANITYPVAFSTNVSRPANTVFSTDQQKVILASSMDRVNLSANTVATSDLTNNQKVINNSTRTVSKAGSSVITSTVLTIDANSTQKTMNTASFNSQAGGIIGSRSNTITTSSSGALNTYVIQPGGSKQPQEYWI